MTESLIDSHKLFIHIELLSGVSLSGAVQPWLSHGTDRGVGYLALSRVALVPELNCGPFALCFQLQYAARLFLVLVVVLLLMIVFVCFLFFSFVVLFVLCVPSSCF